MGRHMDFMRLQASRRAALLCTHAFYSSCCQSFANTDQTIANSARFKRPHAQGFMGHATANRPPRHGTFTLGRALSRGLRGRYVMRKPDRTPHEGEEIQGWQSMLGIKSGINQLPRPSSGAQSD